MVDSEDFKRLNKHKWYALESEKTFYAVRNIGWPNQRRVRMHREILRVPINLETDHRNSCGLDNRKQNLRVCTKAQNQHNQHLRQGTTSQYKGVSWHKKSNLWITYIRCNGKGYYLGTYKNEVEAAKAYDKKAKELFGEFAHLNFSGDIR